jgi:NADH-quinone oxidoreductase subunit N
VAKFAVFTAGAEGGALLLVLIGALASVIAAVFYIRVIVVMFFTEPPIQAPVVAIPSAFTSVAIAVGVAASVLLGVIPQPMLELAQQASIFIR